MALWLIDNYDFIGKTKEDIWDKLCYDGAGFLSKELYSQRDEVSFTIKQLQHASFLYNIDGYVPEMAYLKIYFKNDLVVKVVIGERKSHKDEFIERTVCEEDKGIVKIGAMICYDRELCLRTA
jgi:hypothetical protein